MQRGQIKRVGRCWLLRYWETVIDETGRAVKRRVARKLATYSDQYRTEASVRPLAEEILAPINARTARPESTQELAGFLEHIYLPHCRATLRPSTAKGYTDMLRLVRPHLAGIRLRDVRTSDIDRILRAVAGSRPRAHTTLRNVKSFLSGAFRFAKRSDAVSENPVRDAAVPRGRPKKDRPAYTLDEISTMLKALPEPGRTVVLVAALTGLRLSELKGLRWEDFNGDEVMVERAVWNGKVSETKTLTSRAAVPVVPFLLKALEKHRARNSGAGFVFHGATGQPLRMENLYRRDMRPALEKAGIKWRGWHPFRYGVGTVLHSLGVDSKTIQMILRHADQATTMNLYVKPVADESRRAMRKLERALGRSLSRWAQSG